MIRAELILGTNEEDMQKALSIRREVFCQEQNVPEDLEADGLDSSAFHVLVYYEGNPAATGRLTVMTGDSTLKYVIGRVAVLPQYRGQRLGDLAVRLLIRTAYTMGGEEQLVHSQVPAVGFYEKLGFVTKSEVYEEAGIPHVTMVREGDIFGTCENANKTQPGN